MGWSHRALLHTVILCSSTIAIDPFNLPPLDCSRINVAFCCTSRIRSLCPTQCSAVPCGPTFYHTLFSTDADADLGVGGGQPNLAPEWSFKNGQFREETQRIPQNKPLAIPGEVSSSSQDGDATILIPAKAKPIESATTILPALGTQSPYFSGVTGFPTLIPDTVVASTLSITPYSPPPAVYVTPSTELAYSSTPAAVAAAAVTTLQPVAVTALPTTAAATTVVPTRTTAKPRRRTTPDPRIIKPPSELVIIGEYDEDEAPETVPASVIPSMGVEASTLPATTTTAAAASAAPTVTAAPEQKWHAAVLPHGTDSIGLGPRKEGPEKRIKIFAVDGSTFGRGSNSARTRVQHSIDETAQTAQVAEKPIPTMRNRTGFFLPLSFNFKQRPGQRTDQISASVAGNGPNIDTAAVMPPQFIPQTIRPLFFESTTRAPTTTTVVLTTKPISHLLPISPIVSHHTAGPPAPSPPPSFGGPGLAPQAPNGQCGVAPEFTPCLTAERASRSLLKCCQAKGLPPGCQDLCRYDITQAEVKAAMDAGRCGLLSVQPYLECASQGKDNTECCRHRGIAAKSGPQCIDLCRPHPLQPLGLQHIVCGTVIKDLLQCHHSGVRE